MGHLIRGRRAPAACAAILALCSAGCMMSPQHGQNIGRKNDKVLFAGATPFPGQNIVVEALDFQTRKWEKIAEFHTSGTDDAYRDRNGTWYRWPAVLNDGYKPIPDKYWLYIPTNQYRWTALVRARIDGDRDGLCTFRDGCRWPDTRLEDQWEEFGVRDRSGDPAGYVAVFAQ